MRRTILVLLLGLALAAAAVAGCGGDDDDNGAATETDTATETETGGTAAPGSTLLGSVGPGFDINLTTEDGQDVTTLSPGSYTIEVNDQSDIHNFHLTGPGVETSTTVSEVNEVSWPVELQAGTYEYQCDPHASSMNGSFEVTG
jgi:plastocyanin